MVTEEEYAALVLRAPAPEINDAIPAPEAPEPDTAAPETPTTDAAPAVAVAGPDGDARCSRGRARGAGDPRARCGRFDRGPGDRAPHRRGWRDGRAPIHACACAAGCTRSNPDAARGGRDRARGGRADLSRAVPGGAGGGTAGPGRARGGHDPDHHRGGHAGRACAGRVDPPPLPSAAARQNGGACAGDAAGAGDRPRPTPQWKMPWPRRWPRRTSRLRRRRRPDRR